METATVRIGDIGFDEELLKLRPINAYIVSRYRQSYRSGANMPKVILDKATLKVVSGNHRTTAMLEEYGEDYEVEVEVRDYATRRELLEDFTRENVAHGFPLEGVSRAKIAHALVQNGATAEEIAQLFNVAVKRIVEWCGLTVSVVGGKTKKGITEIIKRGPDIVGDTITREQYETHMARDRGISAQAQAEQIIRWLRNGWIKPEDTRSINALRELAEEIATFMATVEVAS